MFADWAVGAGFERVKGLWVYWLGVGEDGVAVAGWFCLLHVLLPYTTFVAFGNFILWLFLATFWRAGL